MTTTQPEGRLRFPIPRALAAPLIAVGTGLLLWFLLSFLDREAKALALLLPRSMAETARLIAPVVVEETFKFITIMILVATSARMRKALPGSPSGAGIGIVAIVIFSALENLAYLRAFPGADVFQRLLWSEPVHLVSALAFAAGLSGSPVYEEGREPPSKAGRRGRRGAGIALPFALVWHFAANAIADAGPGPAMVAAVAIANFTMIFVLSLLYFDRAMNVDRVLRGPGKAPRPGGSHHG